MATIPGRWACRPDLEAYFVAVVLALAFIPSWRRDAGGQRRRSVGRLNNNGSAAEDEAAARDCRAAPRAMSMQKDPIQAPRIGRCKDMEIIDDAESICRRVRAAGHQRPKPS